jgi:hypothetical protein
MHLSFGLVDGVTLVHLPYLAGERTTKLIKNSIREDVCRVSVMVHFERQESYNKEPKFRRGKSVPTTWMEDGVFDPVGE